VQRGGAPSPFDRVFATRLGHRAAELVGAGSWGRMASWQKGRVTDVALEEASHGPGRCRRTTRSWRSRAASGRVSASSAPAALRPGAQASSTKVMLRALHNSWSGSLRSP
jgi:6-phosphofructokinase